MEQRGLRANRLYPLTRRSPFTPFTPRTATPSAPRRACRTRSASSRRARSSRASPTRLITTVCPNRSTARSYSRVAHALRVVQFAREVVDQRVVGIGERGRLALRASHRRSASARPHRARSDSGCTTPPATASAPPSRESPAPTAAAASRSRSGRTRRAAAPAARVRGCESSRETARSDCRADRSEFPPARPSVRRCASDGIEVGKRLVIMVSLAVVGVRWCSAPSIASASRSTIVVDLRAPCR